MTTRRALLALLLTAGIAAPAEGQFLDATTVRVGPQVVQYRIKAPVDETITEAAVPMFAVVPVGRRFSVDVGTAWTQSRVKHERGESSVGGLTDTQVRGNLTLGNDFIILTAGLNLPTGKSTAGPAEILAASRIGNDFLSFPISNLGTGSAVTGGVGIARPLGNWNLGFGGSVRIASAFEPIRPDSGPRPRYQPGNEYKARLGIDRPIGAGTLAMGFTYSTFGRDDFAGSLYNTGDRYLGQVGFSTASPLGTLSLGAWNLFRSEGQIVGGQTVPWDDIANVSAALEVQTAGGNTIEPNVQLRSWFQRTAANGADAARTDRSLLAELGLRARVGLGGVTVYPGAGFTIGALATGPDATAGLTGFRASLGLQLR